MKQEPRPRRVGWRTAAAFVAIAGLTFTMPTAITMSAQANAPVAGPQTSGDSLFPHVGNGGYDVKHYDLDIAWTPGTPVVSASPIDATATIDATAEYELSSFSLDFEGLTVDSITVDGEPATWTREIDPAAPGGKFKLVITPADSISGDFTTVVEYSGVPTRHTDPDGSFEGWVGTPDGATAVNEPVGAMTWYPNNNSLKDKATYDIKVDIPQQMDGQAMAAASNGVLVSRTPSPDETRETWHWRQTEQMAPYLSMVSIGKYDVHESTIELESGTYQDWTFIDSARTPAQKTTILTNLARTEEILRWMESHFGPYPGISSGAVVDVVPGISYALETQDRSFYSSSVSPSTLIHEIAHQWFGNAVSPTDWSDLWLNEGPGDYMPYAFNYERGYAAATPEATMYTRWNNSPESAAQWAVPLAGFSDPAILFNYVYTRGGMTLEVLRTVVGDEVWFEIMREWVRRYNGGDASTEDFVNLAVEVSGQDVTPVLNDWLYRAADPETGERTKPAWPSRWQLGVRSTATGPVPVGSTVGHVLSAKNTGRVSVTGATAEVDLADLLDDATLDPAALPEGLTLTGEKLTWAVPTVAAGATAQIGFDAVVRQGADGGALVVVASNSGLGAFCGSCSVSTRISGERPLSPSAAPTITGTPRTGAVLTAEPGSWRQGTAFSYQWAVDGVPVAGATAATYQVRPGDAGSQVSVAVTGSLAGWAPVTRTSSPVMAGAERMTRTPKPVLNGKSQVGRKLKVKTGSWDDGVTFTYKWTRNGKAIKNAKNKKVYKLRKADRGKRIQVTVVARKQGYEKVVRKTARTSKVR